jgi:hypothetical protein
LFIHVFRFDLGGKSAQIHAVYLVLCAVVPTRFSLLLFQQLDHGFPGVLQ